MRLANTASCAAMLLQAYLMEITATAWVLVAGYVTLVNMGSM